MGIQGAAAPSGAARSLAPAASAAGVGLGPRAGSARRAIIAMWLKNIFAPCFGQCAFSYADLCHLVYDQRTK